MPSYDNFCSGWGEGPALKEIFEWYQDTYNNYNLLLIEWKTAKTLYAGNHFNHNKTQRVV